MANITPSLPDAHLVRTYPNDYADSDTESEGEAQFEPEKFEPEKETEDQSSISLRFQQNQQFMDEQINPPSGETSAWLLEPQSWKTTEGTDVVLIRKPTASDLSHRVLNPFIYRNIQNVGTLDQLATLLGTPSDWESKYNQVIQDRVIIGLFKHFRGLPGETSKATIKWQFFGLVVSISALLRLHLIPRSETKIIVGGILARYEYDLRSKTDPHFLDFNGLNLIASEVKTHRAW